MITSHARKITWQILLTASDCNLSCFLFGCCFHARKQSQIGKRSMRRANLHPFPSPQDLSVLERVTHKLSRFLIRNVQAESQSRFLIELIGSLLYEILDRHLADLASVPADIDGIAVINADVSNPLEEVSLHAATTAEIDHGIYLSL